MQGGSVRRGSAVGERGHHLHERGVDAAAAHHLERAGQHAAAAPPRDHPRRRLQRQEAPRREAREVGANLVFSIHSFIQ